ncbi:unnamed protein product, partial [Linum tenue]
VEDEGFSIFTFNVLLPDSASVSFLSWLIHIVGAFISIISLHDTTHINPERVSL